MMFNNCSTFLSQFKVDINLAEFACNRFGYTVDAKQSSPNSIVLRKGDGEKLIVTKDLDGHYVYFAPITPSLSTTEGRRPKNGYLQNTY
ncbi:hypothetical protein H8E77_14280 [bacterium]|nr:hypothetical protein [bacterium]